MDTLVEKGTDGQGSAGPSRHMCQFPGCEKTFIRKEHLTRHERSHAPQRSFVCYVCQRGFTRKFVSHCSSYSFLPLSSACGRYHPPILILRIETISTNYFYFSDILRRHIARHNSSARATARNGRACDGCHSSKIKCEGGQPCSPCIKRGIECKFERDEVTVVREAHSNSAITDDDDGVASEGKCISCLRVISRSPDVQNCSVLFFFPGIVWNLTQVQLWSSFCVL